MCGFADLVHESVEVCGNGGGGAAVDAVGEMVRAHQLRRRRARSQQRLRSLLHLQADAEVAIVHIMLVSREN